MSINSDCANVLHEVGLENLHNADDVLFLTPEEESHNHSCGTENEHSHTHKEEENPSDEDEDDETKLAEAAGHKYAANQISMVAGTEFDLNDEDEEPAVKTYSTKSSDDTQTHASNGKDATYSSPVSFDSLSVSNTIDLNASKLNDDANDSSSVVNSHYDENNLNENNINTQQANFLNENQMLAGAASGENDSSFGNLNAKSIIEEPILNDINKYLFKNTRYFLIKSNNYENVNLAKQKVSNLNKNRRMLIVKGKIMLTL